MASAENKADKFKQIRLFNIVMGFLHFVQACAMLALSNDTKVALNTTFLSFNADATPVFQSIKEDLFNLRLGPLVALFLFISSAAHFVISSPAVYSWYEKNLKRGVNFARWYEYAISSSVMILVIAMLCGMYDAPSLMMIFFLNMAMIMFGHVMELHNLTTAKTDWTSFIFGCIIGFIPWVVIGWYFFGATTNAEDGGNPVPGFVYGILISLFIFFNIFAVNMYLQYKKIGPWKDYLFGEKVYIVLSLVAKSLLAWQVFSGTLRPE